MSLASGLLAMGDRVSHCTLALVNLDSHDRPRGDRDGGASSPTFSFSTSSSDSSIGDSPSSSTRTFPPTRRNSPTACSFCRAAKRRFSARPTITDGEPDVFVRRAGAHSRGADVRKNRNVRGGREARRRSVTGVKKRSEGRVPRSLLEKTPTTHPHRARDNGA